MANPMTIAEAKAMQADDLAVDDAAVARAEAEATEAEQAAATLHRSAVDGGEGSAAPGAVLEQRAVAEFARQRAGRIRAKASRARKARRLLDLDKVGDDVRALAATVSTPSESIEAAVAKIAEGRAELLRLCASYDQSVLGLIARARDLGAEDPSPVGPRASSAHVAIVGNGITGASGIQSGNATVRRTDEATARAAAVLAAEGKPEQALNNLQAARYVPAPARSAHYVLGSGGHVHGFDSLDRWAYQLRTGSMRELTPDEVEAYLEGRFHGHQAGG